MIFQQQAGFEITAPQESEGSDYAHIFMGEEYGRFSGTSVDKTE